MNPEEKLFVNYNYVKGAQKFLKEAGVLKYANEEMEDIDAQSVAQSMIENDMNAPMDAAMEDNQVLEVANTLLDLAQEQPSPDKEVLEQAAAELAGSAAPAMGAESEGEEMEEEEEDEASEIEKEVEGAKEAAAKFAAHLKESMNPTPKPDEVYENQKKDYQVAVNADANAKGTGATNLDTSSGEIGNEKNVDEKVVVPEAPDANISQHSEGEDIYKKDYTAPGKGGTTLPTESGEIGNEKNVEEKLANIALNSNLAKLLGRS
jgi:hypothetical protein